MITHRRRMSWRLRVVSRTPTVLLEAQFELLMAIFALTIGPAAALNIVRPTSLEALFPEVFSRGYGVGLVVAGIAIAAGLRTGHPRWPVSSGLNLLGVSTAAYAVAVLATLGMGSAPGAALFFSVAILCWLRAFTITTNLREREIIAQVAVKSS